MRATQGERHAQREALCLIHEINWGKVTVQEKRMHRATSPFVAGKYALKWKIEQYQFLAVDPRDLVATGGSPVAGPRFAVEPLQEPLL